MSKKSLFILLLIPFILAISIFAISSYVVTKVKGDISNIEWDYKNNEVYDIEKGETELKATAILANHQEDVDATLFWSVENLNTEEEPHAKVEVRDGKYYLVFLSKGKVVVTCTNSSGNISKSFTLNIFDGGVININTRRLRSAESIEQKDYYGMYDFNGTKQKAATFYIDVEKIPNNVDEYVSLEFSDNIDYDELTGKITILEAGEAYVKYVSSNPGYVDSEEYKFTVVEDGYNVYSYSDLLNCTNKAEGGKIICLQVNLEAFENTYNADLTKKNATTDLFGTYNESTQKYSFDREVYRFTSTYNCEYIDQYNSATGSNISKEIIAGVHIQKDFYGHGFCINAHNLTYPTGTMSTTDYIVALSDTDLFRGPLPYVIIGRAGTPVIEAYGQDNVGFYVDGNNITLRDVNFKNCIYSNILENNDYTGTVVELNGDNISIINSHLSSGKTVLRSFSNKNTVVKNCLLEKGREFIVKVGTNEYEKMDPNKIIQFTFKGANYSYSYDTFFNSKNKDEWNMYRMSAALLKTSYAVVNEADSSLSDNDRLTLASILNKILSDVTLVKDEHGNLIYKNEITIEDTMFYQSGLFSIGVDTMFNGPYMFNAAPVRDVLNRVDGVVSPNNVAGINYASLVHLKGKTEFYDYKTINQVNLNCIIDTTYLNETINTLLSSMAGSSESIEMTIDDFFPVKKIIERYYEEKGYYATGDNGEKYINTPYVLFGGGINTTTIDLSELDGVSHLDTNIELDIYKEVLLSSSESAGDELYVKGAKVLQKCVSMALGFEPFDLMTYKDAYLFNANVNIKILRSRV